VAINGEGKIRVGEKTPGPIRREELSVGGWSTFSEETQLAKAETKDPTQMTVQEIGCPIWRVAPRVITRRSCQIRASHQGYIKKICSISKRPKSESPFKKACTYVYKYFLFIML